MLVLVVTLVLVLVTLVLVVVLELIMSFVVFFFAGVGVELVVALLNRAPTTCIQPQSART